MNATDRKAYNAVAERADGVCEFCGIRQAEQMHHRKYRSRGGDNAVSNLLHLCHLCHGRAHNGGEREGLSVWRGARPEYWPVLYRGRWVLLLDQPNMAGQWVTEITEATADLLMRGGR